MQRDKIQPIANLLDQALQQLREERDRRAIVKEEGGRELSEAISQIEMGSMKMIQSLFAKEPYTPMRIFTEPPKPENGGAPTP